ncbi:unnamed protein product [Anisakis simplex]|uniref:FLYWCH-type domain-containing protein n=1 Tax=Anisakis simplex TaxID=6269 RepID=A0A0M3K3H8_ANISI|nr:unnamed protein product [Anisakis simplex]
MLRPPKRDLSRAGSERLADSLCSNGTNELSERSDQCSGSSESAKRVCPGTLSQLLTIDVELIGNKIIVNGYIYNRQKKAAHGWRWICVKRHDSCKGAAIIGDTVKESIPHNHPPDPADCEVVRIRYALRQRAATSKDATGVLLNDLLYNVSDEARRAIGNISSLKRFVRRCRTSCLPAPVKRTIVKEERRIGTKYMRRNVAVQVDLTEEVDKVDRGTQTRPRYDLMPTKVIYKFVTDEEADVDEIGEYFSL